MADDFQWMYSGKFAVENMMLAVFAWVVFGLPISWKKFKGGAAYEFVGYWTDLSAYSLGLSDKRTRWVVELLTAGSHVVRRLHAEASATVGFLRRQAPDYWCGQTAGRRLLLGGTELADDDVPLRELGAARDGVLRVTLGPVDVRVGVQHKITIAFGQRTVTVRPRSTTVGDVKRMLGVAASDILSYEGICCKSRCM